VCVRSLVVRGKMARRKELGSLANGLVRSFVSRNNDVDGYWGLGKLYAFAKAQATTQLTIDLLTQEIVPQSAQLEIVAQTHGEKLVSMLSAYGGCITWVESAHIILRFNPHGIEALPRLGDPFICRCQITDDRGQQYEAVVEGHCRPHDPAVESRRSALK